LKNNQKKVNEPEDLKDLKKISCACEKECYRQLWKEERNRTLNCLLKPVKISGFQQGTVKEKTQKNESFIFYP